MSRVQIGGEHLREESRFRTGTARTPTCPNISSSAWRPYARKCLIEYPRWRYEVFVAF